VITDALDTILTLGWAFAAWLTVLATVGTVIIFTLAATGTWAAHLIRRTTGGPAWARSKRAARRYARARRAYDEAA
jgi:hypothetical protein